MPLDAANCWRRTRREALYYGAGLVGAAAPVHRGFAQQFQEPQGKPRIRKVKEFADYLCGAISPDSRRICLHRARKPVAENEAFSPSDVAFAIKVIEVGSWKEIFSSRLTGWPSGFSFFTDGQSLFRDSPLTIPGDRKISSVFDLQTGFVKSRVDPWTPGESPTYAALTGTTLIGSSNSGRFLVQAQWPDLRQMVRIPTGGVCLPLQVDAARMFGVHAVGHSLIYRRVSGFTVAWSREFKWGLNADGSGNVWSAISADGQRVAVAWNPYGQNRTESQIIEVLDSKTGKTFSRLQLAVRQGLELSADGGLIAIPDVIDGERGFRRSVAHIYGISGELLTTLVHDQVAPGRSQFFLSAFPDGARFLPDGKHLITSSATRVIVWELA